MCVNVRAPSLECDSRGSGLHIKISAAVSNALVKQKCGHTVQSNGGNTTEKKDSEAEREYTAVHSHATDHFRVCLWMCGCI